MLICRAILARIFIIQQNVAPAVRGLNVPADAKSSVVITVQSAGWQPQELSLLQAPASKRGFDKNL
jgi:hypothetical protein